MLKGLDTYSHASPGICIPCVENIHSTLTAAGSAATCPSGQVEPKGLFHVSPKYSVAHPLLSKSARMQHLTCSKTHLLPGFASPTDHPNTHAMHPLAQHERLEGHTLLGWFQGLARACQLLHNSRILRLMKVTPITGTADMTSPTRHAMHNLQRLNALSACDNHWRPVAQPIERPCHHYVRKLQTAAYPSGCCLPLAQTPTVYSRHHQVHHQCRWKHQQSQISGRKLTVWTTWST